MLPKVSTLVAALLVIATGCMVGEPADPQSGYSDPNDLSEDSELPAAMELPDVEDAHPDADEVSTGGAAEVGTISYGYGPLVNTTFDYPIYYSGSDFRRWRVFYGSGVDGRIIYRAATSSGTYRLRVDCNDLCFAKQRGYASPGTRYALQYQYRGFNNDGSPRQRVAIWFYDQEMHWLGGRYEYIEESSGTVWVGSVGATAPANTYYAVAEVMYDSDTKERSRFEYDLIGIAPY